MLNLRGIRYNFQVRSVQAPRIVLSQKHGTIRFLAWQALELVYCLLIRDLVAQLHMALFFFLPGSIDSMQLSIRDTNWRMTFLKALVLGRDRTSSSICGIFLLPSFSSPLA
jgi:hypothetical protein